MTARLARTPRTASSGAERATRALRRWAVAGGLLGAVLALLAFAPARWLAQGLAEASQGRLLLAETRGSIWSGSGVLVLSGGPDSRDARVLPDRIEWTLRPQGLGLRLSARQACCINGELQLRIEAGPGRVALLLAEPAADWQLRWPAAWLAGLGTPWNTLQLGGGLRLSSHGFRIEWTEGRWRQLGRLDLDLVNLSSRVATVAPLGSYRLSLAENAASPGLSSLTLQTLDGALLLSGQGTLGGARARFVGQAEAAPGREAGLNNLLNLIGRRDGSRSLISIG